MLFKLKEESKWKKFLGIKLERTRNYERKHEIWLTDPGHVT